MTLNPQNVEFIISAVKQSQLPETGLFEIALAGRSNVGKSSFINTLLNRKNFARTSSQPGKTQQLNYYLIDQQMYLVDVPGYGYAKVSKSQREKWAKFLKNYFTYRENILATLLLIDFRHAPSQKDIEMKQLLDETEVPYFIIATKADKVKRSHWEKHIQRIYHDLELETPEQILPFSSVTKEGRDEAWEIIEGILYGEYDD